jgi:hypothetical protein
VLTGQAEQELSNEAPGVVRYLPAPHCTQAISATAPVVVRYFPAPQLLHVTEPTTALYFPAPQAVHSVFSPVYPRLHTQAVIAVCPVTACPEFAGQTWHTASDVAPT